MRARFARQTARLDAVVEFYTGALGLPELGRFTDHAGFDGVFVDLPPAPMRTSSSSGRHTARRRGRIPRRSSCSTSAVAPQSTISRPLADTMRS
jgi:catechol 2,3-dioxygenase-like lactoylglutathione lyase family enzyme